MSRFHSLFVVIYTRHFVIHCCIVFAVIFGLCFVLGNCRTAAVDDCCHVPFSFPFAHHPMHCQAVTPGASLCSVQSALVRGCCANPCIFQAVVAEFPVLFSVCFHYKPAQHIHTTLPLYKNRFCHVFIQQISITVPTTFGRGRRH